LGERSRKIDHLMASFNSETPYVRRLLIQDNDRSIFLEVQRIDWIEAARNYACIHSGPHTYILRSSLDSLGTKLDPAKFRRISRSEIVNVERIAEVRPASHGDRKMRLKDGTELTWSRRYKSASLEDLELVKSLSSHAQSRLSQIASHPYKSRANCIHETSANYSYPGILHPFIRRRQR
jgi:DNA-binding LytR/AlgR family response regulator